MKMPNYFLLIPDWVENDRGRIGAFYGYASWGRSGIALGIKGRAAADLAGEFKV